MDPLDDLAHLLARLSSTRRAVAWDGGAGSLPDLHQAAALVMRHQPTEPPAAVATQPAIDALVAWMIDGGARLAPGLRMIATPSGARVEATTPIAAGAPIVEVPVARMIRTGDVIARHAAIAAWLGGEPLFGPGALMLWLMCARYGGGAPDPWAPYVDALPDDVPGTALGWPRSPGAHLVAAAKGRGFLAGVLQLHVMLHRRLRDTPEAERPLPLEAFTLARWLRVGAVVSSRQTGLGDDLALVPLWDLLDHDDGGATTTLDGDTLRCVASAPLAAGERVTMCYGRRTPTERWVTAGFVPSGPPDGERAVVPFPLPDAAPLRRDKLVWLLADPTRPLDVTIARDDLDDALVRARWYALDAAELDRLGLRSVADAWGRELVVSDAVEARARELVAAWLDELAGPEISEHAPFSEDHARVLRAARATYTEISRLARSPA